MDDDSVSPEYLANPEAWDAERERILKDVAERWAGPAPEPLMYKHDPAALAKHTEMQSAMEEWRASPEGLRAAAEAKAEEAERERMSAIPVYLSFAQKGYARKKDEEPAFMLLMKTDNDEPDAANCWIAVPEHLTEHLVPDDLEFVIEVPEVKVTEIEAAAEWIHAQSLRWSLKLRAPRRKWQGRNGTLIFSFDDKKGAALFKMWWA